MSLLGDLTARFTPAAEAMMAAVIPQDWDGKLSMVDGKLAETQDRRAKLVQERDALAVEAALGDAIAIKKSDTLEKHIADIDRQLERQHRAREQASDKVTAKNLAELRKRHDAQRATLAADVADWRAKVEVAEAALDDLVMKLNDVAAAGEHVWVKSGSVQVGQQVGDFGKSVAAVIAYRISVAGWPGMRAMSLVPERRKLTGWFPSAEWIVSQFIPGGH